jgi:hypothetical protein
MTELIGGAAFLRIFLFDPPVPQLLENANLTLKKKWVD